MSLSQEPHCILIAFHDIMFLGFGYFEADWIQCEVSLPDES